MQHRLKPLHGSARAGIFAAEAFDELLVTVHDAFTAFDVLFGREAAFAFTRGLESKVSRGRWVSWRAPRHGRDASARRS